MFGMNDAMVDIAGDYGIPVVKSYGSISDMGQFIDDVRGQQNVEGRIIYFVDGHRVKIKCDWYVMLHKAKEAITYEKDVWDIVLNNNIDDVLPVLDKDDSSHLMEFSDAFHSRLIALERDMHDMFDKMNEENTERKEFARHAFSLPDEWQRTLMMNHYTGKRTIKDTLHRMVQMGTRSATYVDEVANQLKLPRWNR